MASYSINVKQDLAGTMERHILKTPLVRNNQYAHVFNVEVTNVGVPYPVGSVEANFVQSNGMTVPLDSTYCSSSGNVATVRLPQACYTVPGRAILVINCESDGGITCIAWFDCTVLNGSTENALDPGTIIPSVETLIDRIDEAVESIPADYSQLLASISDNFSTETPWAAGAYVWGPSNATHPGALYRFTVAHSGTWAEADAVTVSIGNELNDTVRYTQQVHTDAEKAIARTNMSAAAAADLTALSNSVGTVPSGTTVENQIFSQGTQISTNASNIDALQRQVGTVPTGETVEGQISDLKSAFDNVTEPTRNLWIWGDQFVPANGTSTQKGITDVNIPAGTYTLSALVERTGSANCRMVFYKNSVSTANLLANPYIPANSRNSVTFTLSETATIIVIYSGPNATADVDSTWKDIQLEKGNTATEYIYPICCVDPVARAKAEEGLNIVVPLNEQISSVVGTDESFEQKTISAETGYGSGKYWNSENTTAVIANSANYYAYNPFAVSPGEKYKLEITQGGSSKQSPVVVVDSNYTILSAYRDTTIGEKTFIFTIPENGAYILITTTTAAYSGTKLYKAVYSLSQNLSEISGGMFKWNGKNVAIIGDSISTNGDYNPETNPFGNVPEIIITEDDIGVELSAYVTLYDVWTDTTMTTATGLTIGGHTFTDAEIGTEVTFIPTAEDVGKMVGKPATYNPASTVVWWEVAQEKMGFTPIPACWSGASLTDHESGKKLYKASYALHPAMIRKCGIRQPGTMNRISPDVIIVYRGTNDFSHTPYVLLRLPDTEINGYPGTYPESDAVNIDNVWNYGFADGMMVLVKKLREAYPNAVIVFATLNVFKRVNYSAYPTNNGTNTLPQYNDTIRRVAESLGCYLIEFDKDGITFENCYSGGYITDSATMPTHPSDKGHAVMGKRALLDLAKVNGME